MKEAYLFTIILVFAFTTGITWLILKFAFDKYKTRKITNANKKKVYVSNLVITYCGVGTALMNKQTITFRDNTYEAAMKSRQRQQEMANKAHETLASISDTDVFNFEGILVIHKNQFIALEQGTHYEYE